MKKRILFVIDSLRIGGAERSLVTLLNNIDISRYNIDLQLFSRGGELERYLPGKVNMLPIPEFLNYLLKPVLYQFLYPRRFIARMRFFFQHRLRRQDDYETQMLYWECFGRYFTQSEKNYDVAIAYSQGMPTLYVADKIKSSKKITWLNINKTVSPRAKDYYRDYYHSYNKIVVVSDALRKYWDRTLYPELNHRVEVFYDLIDKNFIRSQSEDTPYDMRRDNNRQKIILTVCRLVKDHKGLDILVDACYELRKKDVEFKWYVLGTGNYYEEMSADIKNRDLGDNLILLGKKDNPFPYMRNCDIYVQTSRWEGFGLTIAEAKILEKPVVCTKFEGSEKHIQHEHNGLLTPYEPENIALNIQRLIDDNKLYNSIRLHLKEEKIDNTSTVTDFYKLL